MTVISVGILLQILLVVFLSEVIRNSISAQDFGDNLINAFAGQSCLIDIASYLGLKLLRFRGREDGGPGRLSHRGRLATRFLGNIAARHKPFYC